MNHLLMSCQRASVAYGWGILILAGGGAYYFAKRSINADRQERAEADARRRQAQHRLQYGNAQSGSSEKRSRGEGQTSPGKEAHGGDVSPAAMREEAPPIPDSKYEARRPYRSPKGDRFS